MEAFARRDRALLSTGAGRPLIGLEGMLRIYFLQHWFNLSDPAVEDGLDDPSAMRSFAGIDLKARACARRDDPLPLSSSA
jgi:hypothetical protein